MQFRSIIFYVLIYAVLDQGFLSSMKKESDVYWILQISEENIVHLTLKGPITTAADNIRKYFFIIFQRE